MIELGSGHFESYMKCWWEHFDHIYFIEMSETMGFFERLRKKFGDEWRAIDKDPEMSAMLERATDWVEA